MSINIRYFASLREQSKKSTETVEENFNNPKELYQELKKRYDFTLDIDQVKVSVNGKYQNWDFGLNANDLVVFIPPVAGG